MIFKTPTKEEACRDKTVPATSHVKACTPKKEANKVRLFPFPALYALAKYLDISQERMIRWRISARSILFLCLEFISAICVFHYCCLCDDSVP
jgi:hypothetical protein